VTTSGAVAALPPTDALAALVAAPFTARTE
jgi:hypothetical protein